MKTPTRNLIFALTLLGGLVAANSSHATAVVYEGANYTIGTTSADPDAGLNGGNGLPATNVGGVPTGTSTGLRGGWGTEHSIVTGLSYSNSGGVLATSGGAIKRATGTSWSPSNPFVYRNMTTDPFVGHRSVATGSVLGWNGSYATVLYSSVLLNSTATTGTNEFVFKIGRDNSDSNTFISQVGSNWIRSDFAGNPFTLGPAVAGETVLIVTRMRFESATKFGMDYWFNPTLGQPLPEPAYSINYTTLVSGGQFRSLQTRVAAPDVFTFDEFRVGTTATSVMPIVGATAPAAPSSLGAVANSFSEVALTWADNSGDEIDFVIQRSLTGTDGWRQIAVPPAGSTSYVDTGVNALTTYHYRILAANGGGESAFSNIATVTTPSATVATPPPTGLSAQVDSFSEITLSWTDNTSDETSFVIERSLDGTTEWTALATLAPNTLTYKNISLTAETTYYYRVYANAPGGASEPSVVASATTSALPPLVALDPITLSYDDVDGTDAFDAALVTGVTAYSGQGTVLASSALTYPGLNSSGNGLATASEQRHYISLDTSLPGLARYMSGGQIGGSGLGVLYVRWLAAGHAPQQYTQVEFRTATNSLDASFKATVGTNVSSEFIRAGAATTATGGIGAVSATNFVPGGATDLYIAKFTFAADGATTLDLFINQTTEGTPDATVTGRIVFNTICIAEFGTAEAFSVDEFRIGTSFADVVDSNGSTVGFASWATTNGVTGGVTGDSDNDGVVNALEYALATNLNGSDGSVSGTLANGVLTFTKRQAAMDNGDVTYVIETSTDLALWTPQVTHDGDNLDATIFYTFPPGTPRMFARLRVAIAQ